jgi:transcriptional regulator with GAF, ATPase, and Fis domain
MIVHPAAPSFKELPKQTEKGVFREDFYSRINVIVIPILRERIEDIPLWYFNFVWHVCCFAFCRVSLAALPFFHLFMMPHCHATQTGG